MLILYYLFLKKPLLLLIPYILQVIPYYFILKKLDCKKWCALLPALSEYQFTRKVFKKKRTFFNPFVLACIMVAFAFYVSPYRGVGIVYLLVAFIVYSIFLVALYGKLGKAFGKNWKFTLAAVFFTPIALLKLGLDKSQFTQPAIKPDKMHSKPVTILLRVTYVLVNVVVVLSIVAVASFFSIQQRVPRFMVNIWNDETCELSRSVVDTGDVVSRDDILGSRVYEIVENAGARDKFFPSHKNDKDVVVFVYIVGSNLEDGRGFASVNIDQMIDATKEGSALKFVLETGGAERWFTRGIRNNSYGRYEIADGKLTKVMDLPGNTNMSDANELAKFMKWGKDNYDVDRTMLVMWDHGGGVTSGFGKDDINGGLAQTIPVSGIVKALEAADVKYDVIGFDACLMQDIEIAKELEPYADYYIASEETESGYGWPYTYAFGSLAKNPGIETEEFARRLLSCFDPYNTVNSSDKAVKTDVTLSLVDIPLAAVAYEKLDDMFNNVAEVIVDNPSVFASLSVAAENTYRFHGEQIDLLGFLQTLDDLDYNGKVYDKEKLADLIDTAKASVIYRNGASAFGINGIAFAFGNHNLSSYTMLNTELQDINCINEKKAFDTYFSIMAAQQKKHKESTATLDDGLANYVTGSLIDVTFEKQSWYIPGFEDYDDAEVYVDVPLTETENGYKIEVPDNTWDIITDVQTMVYQRVDDVEGAFTRYLGNDYLGELDENGHFMVDSDDNWVHINGQIVCYEADQIKITKAGEVYTGKIKARLNNSKDIYILIEWDPYVEDVPETAHVTGYISAEDKVMPDEKGSLELVPGDTIQFLFDYYDEHGNFIDTLASGRKIRITKQYRLDVKDLPMKPCVIEFGGVLKDVYQRLMTTEMIEYTITKH